MIKDNYNYDYASGTFGKTFDKTFDIATLISAGLLCGAYPLSSINDQQNFNQYFNVLESPYRTNSNSDTYSGGLGLILSKSPVEKSESSWIAQELSDFMQHSRHVTLNALNELRSALRETYGDVKIETAVHTDPEEGWVMPVITVYSGIEDFDHLLQVEDEFFAEAETNPILSAMLPFVIISQA